MITKSEYVSGRLIELYPKKLPQSGFAVNKQCAISLREKKCHFNFNKCLTLTKHCLSSQPKPGTLQNVLFVRSFLEVSENKVSIQFCQFIGGNFDISSFHQYEKTIFKRQSLSLSLSIILSLRNQFFNKE